MWRDLSMDPNDPRYVEKVINDKRSGSRLISVTNLSGGRFPNNTPDPRSPELRGGVGRLTGGKDGLGSLSVGHLTGEGAAPDLRLGLSALEEIDEISMVAMPDIMPKDRITPKTKVRPPDCRILNQEPQPPPPSSGPLEFPRNFSDSEIAFLQATLIGHCERLKDRVAILDSLRDHLNSEQVIGWRRPTSGTPGLIDSTYGALYFPWVLVPDPLQLTGLLRTVPPSGHVAGIYARGDLRVGVHKPPANEELEAVKDVRVAVDDLAHGDLNNHGINVIRAQQGRGVRVSGARTIAPSDKPEWRYINVRRLLLMIEEAIDEQTQWTVFEPNNPDLWREVDRVARSFLDGLWRRGMLDGATAEEAYFVRCDETTNPADQTEAGRLICEIGVLPPWPAEFVVVRIGKTEGGTEILENERSE
jgi:hypothetical protein